MKRPNGTGSITKTTDKRRKQYRAVVTSKWDKTGKQKKVTLGYFKTRSEAENALSNYNLNPIDLNYLNITFEEVYNKWSNQKYKTLGHSAILGYQAAFTKSEKLHKMKMNEIKTLHLQSTVDNSDIGHASKRKMKYLYGQLFEYCMQNDIVSKDYSEYVKIGQNTSESKRVPFNRNEIDLLWKNVDDIDFIDTILILIYTGFRIQELLELKTANIDFEEMTMRGGKKTEAGKNRLVPIHPSILPLIKKRYNSNNEFLIVNHKGKEMKYHNYYREKFLPIMERFSMNHRPHDCRHTFATLLNNAGANSTAIKTMVGHKNFTTTEKIYTHKDIEELRKNIELIK